LIDVDDPTESADYSAGCAFSCGILPRKLGLAVQLACSLFLQCLACLLNLAGFALHFLARVRQQTRPLLQLFIGPL